MKNDFREFYDEDYIRHSMSEEEYIAHGEWANNIRKYIDKVRTRSGKWKYIYPEDLKKKAANLKRDVSYAARNLKSKITRTNKTFNKKVAGFNNNGNVDGSGHWEGVTRDLKPNGHKLNVKKNKYGAWELPSGGVTYVNTKENIHNAYARENKKANKGMSKYNERHQQELEKEKRAKNIKYKQSDYSKVMNKNEKRKKLASYMKAANKGSTYSKLSSSTKDGIKRNLNSNIPDDRNIKVTYKSKYRSKFQTTTPTEKRYRKLTVKEKYINKKGR